MAYRFPVSLASIMDANGDPISGAKLNFYQVGTATRHDSFSDNALLIANTNPLVADSSGRFGDCFLQADDYKVVLTDAADAVLVTMETVHGQTAPGGSLTGVDGAVAAAGATQGTATLLSKRINVITTLTATTADGVRLPVAVPGDEIMVRNHGGATLGIWPSVDGKINELSVDAEFTLADGAGATLVCAVATIWVAV